MRSKQILAVSLMVIIALSIVGFVYAHWSDIVTIEGTVKMGTGSIGFTELVCEEMYADPVTGLKVPGEWLGKDVGWVEYTLVDLVQDPHTEKFGYKTALVTIHNAYPSYQVHIIFAIENLGTIPVIFTEINIWDPTGTLDWDDVLLALVDPVTGDPIINFDVVNLIGIQLDYCQDTKAEVDVHFKQEAEECHTYQFMVQIVAVQWNKA